ncbi:MAG TPA: C4-type zinc ribbon domain-containing protein [Acidobacteriota bacterium]|nr:C4-type zinc ribbon domain-containing protein [Acidobacteriota bacterium]
MSNNVELLLKLQGLDYQLDELERSKDYLPDMIKNLRDAVDQAGVELTEARDQLEATQLEHKRLELRVKEKNSELERLQKQMTAIKTNKEYDALSREIDHVRKEIGAAEDGIIQAMERTEELAKEIEDRKARREEIKETNGVQLASIQGEIDSVGEKIRIKEDERRNILVRLDDGMVSTYERVRRGKGGGAVVGVRKNACLGCFKTLPPQLVQEIRRGERLITCDSCGRILIWTNGD